MFEPSVVSDNIKSAKKVLLVTHSRPNIDTICSLGAIYLLLKNQYKKEVDISIPSEIGKRFDKILEKAGISKDKLISALPERTYIISIDKGTGSFEQSSVSWNETDDKFNFIINPNDAKLDVDNISVKEGGANYDVIISIDTPSLNFLGDIYKDNSAFFKSTPIISFDNHKSNTGFAKYNVEYEDMDTTSQVVLHFIEEVGLKIGEDEANLLFAGILSFLNLNIKNKVRPNAFNDLGTLVSHKAKPLLANDMLYSPYTSGEIFLIGDILDSTIEGTSKVFEDAPIVGCKINLNKEEVETIDVDKVSQIVSWNIKMPGVKLSYIIFQKSPNESISYIYAYDSDINLSDVLKKLDGKGDRTSGKIQMLVDMNGAENKIKEELGITLSEKQNKFMNPMDDMFGTGGFDDLYDEPAFPAAPSFPTSPEASMPSFTKPTASPVEEKKEEEKKEDGVNAKSTPPMFDPRKGV